MGTPTSILILPGLLGTPEMPWLRNQSLANLRHLSSQSAVFGLNWSGTEAEIVGLNPAYQMRQGPLTVAGLGADPPPRSVHFHVSVLSLVGDVGDVPGYDIPGELESVIASCLLRLNTKSLTVVLGQGQNHGLVWEPGSLDLGTISPYSFNGRPFSQVLPEGDGEPLLRRFIDDSINLLAEQEFNLIRREEGLPPLNAFWPWGHGFRQDLPNLALRRGSVSSFWSSSLRLAGIARLAGYRHSNRLTLGRGTSVLLAELAKWLRMDGHNVGVVGEFGEWREREAYDEYGWLLKELDGHLEPFIDGSRRLALLAPGSPGLAFIYDPDNREVGTCPFDERAFEEKLVQHQLFEVVASLL